MARIIRKGVVPSSLLYRYVCPDCKSLVEFSQSDVRSDPRDGNYVNCPLCKKYLSWDVIREEGEKRIPKSSGIQE